MKYLIKQTEANAYSIIELQRNCRKDLIRQTSLPVRGEVNLSFKLHKIDFITFALAFTFE
jgi:hypothetical protein